jgi:hypothetical protein
MSEDQKVVLAYKGFDKDLACSPVGGMTNAATTGYRANAATTGEGANAATTGKNAISACLGQNGQAKANENGAVIVAYWDSSADRPRVAVGYVGEGIKPDTWYCVRDGELVEVEPATEEETA